MIVKKVPTQKQGRDTGGDRARHVRALVDYMNTPEKASALGDYLIGYMQNEGLGDRSAERLLHFGSRNFVSIELIGQRAEMMAVAQAATRSPNPIDHWILSWRESLQPTRPEIEEAVAMFVDDLGLRDHQCIYAAHGDTHNIHVHIAVNRYDIRSRKVTTVNNGFSHEAGHAAVARICDRFGWEPEEGARFEVIDGTVRMTEEARRRRDEGDRPITNAAAAQEARTGHRWSLRIAQEDAWPIIREALSWRDLHTRLAEAGFAYAASGANGACIIVDRTKVKASSIHQQATIAAITNRLKQEFKPRTADIRIVERDRTRDAFPHAFRADEYRDSIKRRQAETVMHREQRQQAREAIASLRLNRREDLTEVRSLDWKGREIERDLLIDAIREVGKEFEKKIKVAARPRVAADYETWLREQDEHWFAERLRKRRSPPDPKAILTGTVGAMVSNSPETIDGYRPSAIAGGVRYARHGEGTAFIDYGNRIDVVPGRSDDALLAALRLAALNFNGKVVVKADAKVRERIYALAVRHRLGHVLADPDMITRERWRTAAVKRKADETPSRIDDHVLRPDIDLLAAAGRVFFALHQSRARRAGSLGTAGSRSGLHRLSGFHVVRGQPETEMFLRDRQRPDVGR